MPDAAFTVVLVIGLFVVVVLGFTLSEQDEMITILIVWQGLNTLLTLYVATWCYRIQSHREEG